MAIEYLGSDGYDNGTLRVPWMSQVNGVPSVAEQHTGAYSCVLSWANSYVQYTVTGTPNNCSVSVWLYLLQGYDTDGSTKIQFILSTAEIIDLIWDGVNHTFDAYVDGVKVADGTIEILINDWFNIQFYAVIDNAGSIDVRIGGQESINYVGDTLPIGAAAEVSYLKVSNHFANAQALYVDDTVWGTGGYLEDCRVEWRAPNGDTGVNDWTPSAGVDNYAVIDEIPASDADYTETNINTDEVEMDLENWDGVGKTPVLVTAWARMKEDVATGEQIEVGVDSNGVDETTLRTCTDAWQYQNHVMQENPDGPVAWAQAAISALKARYEAVI